MLAAEIRMVAEKHGINVGALEKAAGHTDDKLSQFRRYLRRELEGPDAANPLPIPNHVDVVLFGSFGRSELTSASDCDYLVLLDGSPEPQNIQRVVRAAELTRSALSLEGPGKTGTFGEIVTAAELVTRIGLEADSNSNTTRRILLLAESVSALDPSITDQIKKKVLERYLGDYSPAGGRES